MLHGFISDTVKANSIEAMYSVQRQLHERTVAQGPLHSIDGLVFLSRSATRWSGGDDRSTS